MQLQRTAFPGAYELTWDQARVKAYVLSTEQSRQVLCDGSLVGVPFQERLGQSVQQAVQLIDTIDSEFSSMLRTTSPSVLNILRGGLNFRIQDACETVSGLPATVSFMTSERAVDDGKAIITNDAYRKMSFASDSVLVIADIAATGSTLSNALDHVFSDDAGYGGPPGTILVVTIGSLNALRSIDSAVHRLCRDKQASSLEVYVVMLEGAFGLYEESRVRLPFHLDSTDFVRAGGAIAPEFMIHSLRNPLSLLERCVIYDGGVRGFAPMDHLTALDAYWTGLVTLFRSDPAEAGRHLAAKTGEDIFARGTKGDGLSTLTWSALPEELSNQVYDVASHIDVSSDALIDICAVRLDEIRRLS